MSSLMTFSQREPLTEEEALDYAIAWLLAGIRRLA